MAKISEFVSPKLKTGLLRFAESAESNGVSQAAKDLQEFAFGSSSEEITDGIVKNYGVTRDEANFFMQECGRIVSSLPRDTMTLNDKRSALKVLRETDIPSPMKNEWCIDLANGAIASGNRQLLSSACIESDGLSSSDYEAISGKIESVFGSDESERVEMVIKTKENPEQAVSMLAEKAEDKSITTEEYLDRIGQLENDLPEAYLKSTDLHLSTEETEEGFSIKVNMNGLDNDSISSVQITDDLQDNENEGLKIQKEDAVRIVQKYEIYGDNVMDCIASANIPPENPNFVSEMEQKFANYISERAVPQVSVPGEERKLCSVLPDDMKESFLAVRNDMQYERDEQISMEFTNRDEDHNGIPDIDEDRDEEDIDEI